MQFVCDVMLGRLAKRMRLRGHDVLYSSRAGDNDIIRLALEQGRTILTRDAALASRPLARGSLLIASDRIAEQLRQVEERFPPPDAPLSRCSLCNTRLDAPPRCDLQDLVPRHVLGSHSEFLFCPSCGRIYWPGSHVQRMQAKDAGPGRPDERQDRPGR